MGALALLGLKVEVAEVENQKVVMLKAYTRYQSAEGLKWEYKGNFIINFFFERKRER